LATLSVACVELTRS